MGGVNVRVLHVARGFSAQPTLRDALGDADVVEVPLAEAVLRPEPDLVWVSDARPEEVLALRERFPGAGLLATLGLRADPDDVVLLLACGADLVLRDEGVLLAAAGLQSLARRRATSRG
jgi:hypothetical protein